MTTRQFTHPLSQTGQGMPLTQGIETHLATVPEAPETRRPLQRLGDFLLDLLDRYVQLVGPDTSEPQAPTVSWTPYSGTTLEAMRWRGNRYRWWGS
jgi:hypothetical protein